jgi:hypothetical protein
LLLNYLNNVEKHLKHWFSTQGGFVPGDMAVSGDTGVMTRGGTVPGILWALTAHCPGQTPNVHQAKAEKLDLKKCKKLPQILPL